MAGLQSPRSALGPRVITWWAGPSCGSLLVALEWHAKLWYPALFREFKRDYFIISASSGIVGRLLPVNVDEQGWLQRQGTPGG